MIKNNDDKENTQILSKEDKQKYNECLRNAKEYLENKEYVDAYLCYKSALNVYQDNEALINKLEKLKRKCLKKSKYWNNSKVFIKDDYCNHNKFWYHIIRDEYVLKSTNEESNKHFYLPLSIYRQLYSYQHECLQWFWKLHCEDVFGGGILGDDMGLGKTVQISSFICGLWNSCVNNEYPSILIFAPKSVLKHWELELIKWCSNIPIKYFEGNEKKRVQNLCDILNNGGILLSTYGKINTNWQRLSQLNTISSIDEWDYTILDEGHLIKNPDINRSKFVRKIPSLHRLLLTGTPIQNKLEEMWSLFDFACQGSLLGDRKTFKSEYAQKILIGSDRKATIRQQQLATKTAESLRELIKPFFLRRTKADLQEANKLASEAAAKSTISLSPLSSSSSSSKSTNTLDTNNKNHINIPQNSLLNNEVSKTDLIIWTYLSESQLILYRAFLQSAEVKAALNCTRSPLAALTILKKICDHPRLLHEELKTCRSLPILPSTFAYDANTLLNESGKLRILCNLLKYHKDTGHRTLIFSQSKKMLDMIEIICAEENLKLLRIDGDVKSADQRQHIVKTFNEDERYSCCLLTTQTGGLGLNLIGADRVIIFDPNWNPAVDNQAVDRVYRIGQTSDVIIYRFITCGTLEEVIYRKQIFKGGLMKTATEKMNIHGYFTRNELSDVFSLQNPNDSQTQRQLEALHAASTQEKSKDFKILVDYIKAMNNIVFGISDHQLLFSVTPEELLEIEPSIQEEVDQARSRLVATTPMKLLPKRKLGRKIKGKKPPLPPNNDNNDDKNNTNNTNNVNDDNNDAEELSKHLKNLSLSSKNRKLHLLPLEQFKTLESESCSLHCNIIINDSNKKYKFKSIRCRCCLSISERIQYNKMISQAEEQLNNNNNMKLLALESCLNALEICDDNPNLHLCILNLASELDINCLCSNKHD